MDEKIREVAQVGNIDAMYSLIQENPFVLESIDGFPFVDTPLHIAASEGHVDFVMEMMNLKPSFARKLNPSGFSPMHLALQNDRNLVVDEMLKVDKDLIRVKGKCGLTPFHLAAEKGRLNHIAEFLQACPECITDVTIHGQTALHCATTYNNFEALQLMIRWLQKTTHKDGDIWEEQVLNKKDRAGNTILHIAASNNRFQIVKWLVKCRIKNEVNLDGRTALEMLEGQHDMRKTARTLRWAGYLNSEASHPRQTLVESIRSECSCLGKLQRYLTRQNNKISSDTRNAMLVVLSLLLTSSYQACFNPPGGVYQGDGDSNSSNTTSHVGKSVLPPIDCAVFYVMNTATFLTSSCMVFFLLLDETISPVTIAVLPFIICYNLSLDLIFPNTPPQKSSSYVFEIGSLIFVFWPKVLNLYYRKKQTSWAIFLFLFFLLLCALIITFASFLPI